MSIDEILNAIQASHGNSLAFRAAIQELRRLNNAAPKPIFELLFEQHVSMLRNSRTSKKCREGCLRELRVITEPGSQVVGNGGAE